MVRLVVVLVAPLRAAYFLISMFLQPGNVLSSASSMQSFAVFPSDADKSFKALWTSWVSLIVMDVSFFSIFTPAINTYSNQYIMSIKTTTAIPLAAMPLGW